MQRTREEIDDQLAKIDPELAAGGGASQWPGMSYEQGVDSALHWVLGDSDDAPMDDE